MTLDKIDFHVHTNRSRCGQQDLPLNLVIAEYEARSFQAIGLTDHYYQDLGDQPFRETRQELSSLDTNIEVYLSAEIEAADAEGNLDCSDLEELKGILDYVSAAPHPHNFAAIASDYNSLLSLMHRVHLGLTQNKDVAVILHPWDTPKRFRNPFPEIRPGWLREFAKVARRGHKIVEVSNCMSHYWSKAKIYEIGTPPNRSIVFGSNPIIFHRARSGTNVDVWR